jgi:hypothetical protein
MPKQKLWLTAEKEIVKTDDENYRKKDKEVWRMRHWSIEK